MNTILLGVLLYLLIQFVIGVAVSRRITSEADYLLAGRRLGLALGAFSVFATWFGAETIVGAAGAIYENGLAGGSADPFGYALCLILGGRCGERAYAALAVGMLVWLAGEYVLAWSTPYLIALGSALVTYLGAALVERVVVLRPRAADEELSSSR